MTAEDARDLHLGPRSHAGRAEVLVPADPRRLDIRAEGPGLLVVSEGWDRGWSAAVDDAPAPIVRVNHAEMAVALALGTALGALTALLLGVSVARGARRKRS